MKVEICSWNDISWIPEKYDTEYATFSKRKKQETWFKAIDGKDLLGVGCLLHLSATTARHSNDFVLPEHRGKGVIKEIIKFRESWARLHGLKELDTRTVKKYYEPLGYTKIKEYKVGGSWYVKELQ